MKALLSPLSGDPFNLHDDARHSCPRSWRLLVLSILQAPLLTHPPPRTIILPSTQVRPIPPPPPPPPRRRRKERPKSPKRSLRRSQHRQPRHPSYYPNSSPPNSPQQQPKPPRSPPTAPSTSQSPSPSPTPEDTRVTAASPASSGSSSGTSHRTNRPPRSPAGQSTGTRSPGRGGSGSFLCLAGETWGGHGPALTADTPTMPLSRGAAGAVWLRGGRIARGGVAGRGLLMTLPGWWVLNLPRRWGPRFSLGEGVS